MAVVSIGLLPGVSSVQGSQGQVLVNGLLTPQNGAVVLTLDGGITGATGLNALLTGMSGALVLQIQSAAGVLSLNNVTGLLTLASAPANANYVKVTTSGTTIFISGDITPLLSGISLAGGGQLSGTSGSVFLTTAAGSQQKVQAMVGPSGRVLILNTSAGNDYTSLEFSNPTIGPDQLGGSAYVRAIRTANAGSLTDLAFGTMTAGTVNERMRIISSGNVGIGTALPNALLELSKSAATIGPELRLNNPNDAVGNQFAISAYDGGSVVPFRGSLMWTLDAAGKGQLDIRGGAGVALLTGQSPYLTILGAGNIGIANTNPGYNLDVSGTIHSTSDLTVDAGAGSAANANLFLVGRAAGVANSVNIFANQQGGLNVQPTASRQMCISNSGATVTNNGALLQVASNMSIGANFRSGLNVPTNGLIVEGNVGLGIAAPSYPLSFPAAVGDKISFYPTADAGYGIGVQATVLQIYSDTAITRVGIGNGSSAAFTETLSVSGNSVGVGIIAPSGLFDVFSNANQNLDVYFNNGRGTATDRTRLFMPAGGRQWQIENDQNLSLFKIRDNTASADVLTLRNGSANNTLNITSTGVGILTTTPLAALNVFGVILAGAAASAPLSTSTNASAVEVNIAANSLITLGDRGTGIANPAITLYRTSAGVRVGTAARLLQDNSNFAFKIQQGTNNTGYGLETYTDRMTFTNGGIGVGTNSPAEAFHVGSGNFRTDGNSLLAATGGNVVIGTTDLTNSSVLRLAVPFAKTDTTARNAAFFSSNEAVGSNPFGLNVSIKGAAALVNRTVFVDTSDFNLGFGGNLVLQQTSGFVGIGTATPTDILVAQSASGSQARITVVAGGFGQQPGFQMGWPGNVNAGILRTDLAGANGGDVSLWSKPDGGSVTQRVTILGSGNVGIGTTTPGYKLEVHPVADGNIVIRPGSDFGAGYGGGGIQSVNDAHTVATMLVLGGTPIVMNGNVGIGIPAPTALLHISGGNLRAEGPAYFGVTGGNVGIGTTTPTALLEIGTNGTTAQGLLVHGGDGGAGTTIANFVKNGGTSALFVRGNGAVGVGTTTPNYTFEVSGSMGATTKSFDIPHPTLPGRRLVHGVTESPEHSVFLRGRLVGSGVVAFPHYWSGLVRPESITVQLTPIGAPQGVVYVSGDPTVAGFTVAGAPAESLNLFWRAEGERADVAQLVVEPAPTEGQ